MSFYGLQRLLNLTTVALVLLLTPLLTPAYAAGTTSENLIFLQNDGRSYTQHRTLRSESPTYSFHVEKNFNENEFLYIYPNQYSWDTQSSELTNILRFNQGNFVVMLPGKFETEITSDKQGIHTFKSWDGVVREDGLFGFWNSPKNFADFVYGWVIPDHFEILSFQSNRKGEWVRRQSTLVFYAKDVNSLTFEIKFRHKDADLDGVGYASDKCPDSLTGIQVDDFGCELDSDMDGVTDDKDQCPDSSLGVTVNEAGCELDSDNDGVVDSIDRCLDSPSDVQVNEFGCELDSDSDGIADSKDQCPDSSAGVTVDESGCGLDSDKDGVMDSIDRCLDSPSDVQVNELDCELDSDSDGVADSKDQCPDSSVAVTVNEAGCELDSDNDGVVDSLDQCLGSPSDVQVNELGCELDSDSDGIVDSKDLCINTPAEVAVNGIGCEIQPEAKPVILTLDGVNFHINSAELTEESHTILDGIAMSLEQYADTILEVAGHTDSIGDAAYNLHLSQMRAEAVRLYLIRSGIDPTKLLATGYGEAIPVAENTTKKGRATNRRVEILRAEQN